MEREYYFRVFDDGDTIIRCVNVEAGREVGYSDHSTNDETLADGDGSLCAPDWSDAQAWSRTTREHAELLLGFPLEAA